MNLQKLATLITREFFLSTALFQHLTNDERSREENLSKKHQFMGFSFHKNDALFSSLRTKQKDDAARQRKIREISHFCLIWLQEAKFLSQVLKTVKCETFKNIIMNVLPLANISDKPNRTMTQERTSTYLQAQWPVCLQIMT